MANLTVGEARRRAASIDVRGYRVELDLDRGDTHFESTTVIEFTSSDATPTFVDIAPATLHSVELNGAPVDVGLLAEERVRLDPVAGPNALTVTATMSYSHDGEGLHRTVDPEDGRHYVYAMTFLAAAPRVFACFDQPDLKAELSLRVKAPHDWTVVGNGRATAHQPVGGGSPDGWWDLATTKPLSTYLMTLVAGPYHSITSEHDGITLGLHCRRSLAPHLDKDADELFELTRQCFDEYHRLFGIRYPFGDYHQVFVPEFNAGAMENPGCVTFDDELVFRARASAALRSLRANIVAHEMAHMWFGDLVTMRWWDDLWLNESFADYMGHRVCVDVTDFTDRWLLFALGNKHSGLDADQRSSTHPVAGNGSPDARSALTNFDGISYAKGAVVLRQLHNYLGEEAFIAGIVDHLTTHAYGNATFADLVDSWQRSSGRDLTAWTDAWLRTSGVDTLSVADGSPAVVTRRNGSRSDVSRVHAVKVTSYDDQGAGTTVPVVLTEETTDVELPAPMALGLPDSDDESWAKVELDASAMATLPALLPRIERPVSRAVIWGSVRDALLDARMSPDSYLDVVCDALPPEAEDRIVEWVLTESVLRAGTYLHTGAQQERLEHLVAEMLAGSDPGSNRQLIAGRLLLKTSSDVTMLWSWLDGHAPSGLLVDADLRWRILTQLCALGAAGRDEITSERAADPSSQGALAALRCRAAIPSAPSKASVWESIASDADISNHDLYALCDSFFRASQQELTRPYVARYFIDLPASASFRNGWVVELSARAAFPGYAATAETLRLAETALASDGVDPFARRAISDSTDDLRRLLASRAAYAAG